MLHLLILLAGTVVTSTYSADGKNGCVTYASAVLAKPVIYCVERTRPDLPQADGEAVVYYMHGVSEDHTHWVKEGYSKTLADLRQLVSLPPVTFIAFDSAKQSYFTDRGMRRSGKDAYETWFMAEFVPKMERERKLCHSPACRGIMGHSMGGLGALGMAFRYPGTFSTVATNAAAIAPFNVFEGIGKWFTYFNRHPIPQYHGMALIWDTRRAFTTPENFDRHYPPTMVRDYPEGVAFPKLYFDVGGRDYYGFEEGHELFRQALDARGYAYHWDYYPDGKHGVRKEPERRMRSLSAVIESLR